MTVARLFILNIFRGLDHAFILWCYRMDIRLNCIVNLRIFTRNANYKDVIMDDHHSILFITRRTHFSNRSSHFDNTSSRFNKTKNYFNTRSRNFKAFQVSEAATHIGFFLRKGILKISSKFTGEHPCRSLISIKLLCNSGRQLLKYLPSLDPNKASIITKT